MSNEESIINEDTEPTVSLKFAPDILRRLGEELIPHVDQGILELVRNAYDADAVNCSVELIDVENAGGAIRIVDDGTGMSYSDITAGWLVLGRSGKVGRELTKKLQRLPVGDKGLGRLAALRLGAQARLVTRSADNPGIEYELTLNWTDFDKAATVESVPLRIEQRVSIAAPGTEIEIIGLRISLNRMDVQRLARSLVLLADPFGSSTGFRPTLQSPEFEDISRLVSDLYFDDAEFKLVAELNAEGQASAVVYGYPSSNVLFRTNASDLNAPYKTALASFTMWTFVLDKPTFSRRNSSVTEVRDWLQEVGGVHLYHRGLRVYPYGDKGHDWLDMNLRRAQSPEVRPSTNTVIGLVKVEDGGDVLLQKTDRTGFVENEAFIELRRFAHDALEWMAKERLKQREIRRIQDKTTAEEKLAQAKGLVSNAIKELPNEYRSKVENAVKKLEDEGERVAKSLKEDLHLYRTLATVGTTAAVFAHESAQPVTRIERTADEIMRQVKGELNLYERDNIATLADIVKKASRSIRSFAGLPINLLKREKRKLGSVDINAVVTDLSELFTPFLTESKIGVKLTLIDNPSPVVWGSITSIESIVANLLTNAAHALIYRGRKRTGIRSILIETSLSSDKVLLRVLDNGPGIKNINKDEIWLPGRTTKTGGCGLGLTIVKDVATDLNGNVQVISPGELGGAEFLVLLPLFLKEGD
ncbi:MAG: ATP-binding protein [Armatimonadetes bacterium]|nr:ATP-binding protein [Armatimonadota bacterium]